MPRPGRSRRGRTHSHDGASTRRGGVGETAGDVRGLWPRSSGRTVAVVDGFVGRAPDGSTTTLGRAGLPVGDRDRARARPREVWICPSERRARRRPALVPGAELMPRLSYHEAHLRGLGARSSTQDDEPAAEARMTSRAQPFANGPPERALADLRRAGSVCSVRRKVERALPCANGRPQRDGYGVSRLPVGGLKLGPAPLRRQDPLPARRLRLRRPSVVTGSRARTTSGCCTVTVTATPG